MNRMSQLLLCSALLFSAASQAALIRDGGRGSATSSNRFDYYLIADDQVNAFGVQYGFTALERTSLIAGQIPLFAVPTTCYVDVTIMPPGFVDKPCYYQFYQQEQLQFEGFAAAFFAVGMQSELNWNLSGNGFSRDFSGSAGNPLLALDTLMPPDLLPGEYQLSLQLKFTANQGYRFYTDTNAHSDEQLCGELTANDPNSFICSHNWYGTDSLTFNANTERVQLLAGQRPVAVAAPASAGLLLLSVLWLGWRRRLLQ